MIKLGAFNKLLTERGYRLIGCISLGFNAFFLKNGIGDKEFPKIDPSNCFRHWERDEWNNVMKGRIEIAKQYSWVEV
jgi:hypothetical protein